MTDDTLGDIDPRPSFSNVMPKLQIAWDSVSMGAFKTCPRKYQLQIIDGWTAKRESHHLRYGILYHRALEVYDHKRAEGLDHNVAMFEAIKDLIKGCTDIEAVTGTVWWNPSQYLSEKMAENNTKTVPNLFRTVVWYLEEHKNDVLRTAILANGKPAVELSFRYEIGHTFSTGEELLHSGHIDKVAYLGDLAYVVDKKTTKNSITDNSAQQYFAQFSPDNQMSGYSFAGRVALTMPIEGVIIDAAQIAKGFSRFVRGFAPRTVGQLEEWQFDFIMHARLAEQYAKMDYWPMNDTSCDKYGGCTFRGICNRDPSIRKILLSTDFTKRPWDPLEVRGDI